MGKEVKKEYLRCSNCKNPNLLQNNIINIIKEDGKENIVKVGDLLTCANCNKKISVKKTS